MPFTHHAESPNTGNYYRFKVLGAKVLAVGNGYDEGAYVRFRVIGDKEQNQEDQRRALSRSMNSEGCHHEYDCCGCASTYASVHKVKPGIFSVKAHTSYNY